MTAYHHSPKDFRPLDDLPNDRLAEALNMIQHLRRHVPADCPVLWFNTSGRDARTIADLFAAGIVLVDVSHTGGYVSLRNTGEAK